jgi:hypothetical protein
VLGRGLRARGGFGVLLEIKTTRLRRVVSEVRRGSRPGLDSPPKRPRDRTVT